MRAVLIPTWIVVATAIVIIAATAVVLVPGITRLHELEECDRTRGTPSYDYEVCGNM